MIVNLKVILILIIISINKALKNGLFNWLVNKKFIDLIIYQSINLSIYQSINLSIYQSINLSIYQSIKDLTVDTGERSNLVCRVEPAQCGAVHSIKWYKDNIRKTIVCIFWFKGCFKVLLRFAISKCLLKRTVEEICNHII